MTRPKTRADCINGPRPCQHITCRHHLVDIKKKDTEKTVRDRARKLTETCSLDVAEWGGATLEEVGELLGLSRERMRQNEASALNKLRRVESVTGGVDLTHLIKPTDRKDTSWGEPVSIGTEYGMLTVLDLGPPYGNGMTRWLCKCSCGAEKLVGDVNLKSGGTRSCGCQRGRNFNDLKGSKYAHLTVLEKVASDDRGVTWSCRCDCGSLVDVLASRLRAGQRRSCGCKARSKKRKAA